MKTTGAEFKEFYNDPQMWPVGVYHDDTLIKIDGVHIDDFISSSGDIDKIPDTATVEFFGGYVTDEAGKDYGSFTGWYKKWKKQQTTAMLLVKVPKEKVEALTVAIVAAGGKVL